MTLRVSPHDPITVLPKLGPKAAADLDKAFQIVTILDLVEHYPFRYEDPGDVTDPDAVQKGDNATFVGTVVGWNHRQIPKGRRRLEISVAKVRTDAGRIFEASFFNQRWRAPTMPVGTRAAFSGTVEVFRSTTQLKQPRVVEVEPGADPDHLGLTPVYHATAALPSHKLAAWIRTALEALPPQPDPLPPELRASQQLIGLDLAMRQIHTGRTREHVGAARKRLTFDELFTLQVGLQWRRRRLEAETRGKSSPPRPDLLADQFLASLPYTPTGAQRRAFDEIGVDLARERPMHRLLQGDVGAGKTLVAAWSMLAVVDNGRQAALMVPTEVLAEQHFRTLLAQLEPLGVNMMDGPRIALLSGSSTQSERRTILADLASGHVDILVGTHALLEDVVQFRDLGLVVVDEQHRFGVQQRVRLKDKGVDEIEVARAELRGEAPPKPVMPDVLVMTATPIPRSLALTLYGDLDVTVLDEMPPGRTPIRTDWIRPEDEARRRPALEDFIRKEAAAGRQTYVVCALVEDSDELELTSAVSEHRRLSEEVFPDLGVELVHGRLRSDDKEAAMTRFRRGEAKVLVATTVIEVGVDVPQATIMVIEDAHRFGISQLHQLRGRVGRGTDQSYCVLLGEPSTDDGEARLLALVASTDGFVLAEEDLKLRGEGDIFGERQSGRREGLKLARALRDLALIGRTRDLAVEILDADADLSRPEHRGILTRLRERFPGGEEEFEALHTG